MKGRKTLNYAIAFSIITLVFTLLVWKVDVKPLGVTHTPVGLSFINKFMLRDYNELCDKLAIILGYVAFVVLGIMALIGLVQLIKRRSLLKVDKKILGAGVMFLITLALYVLFTKVSINYRPVILPGETELELSYPSSHTMMVVVICGAALYLVEDYIKNEKLLKFAKICLDALLILMILFRLRSGTHWFTDIIGGVLFGVTLLLWYGVAVEEKETAKHYKHEKRNI